VEPEHGGVTELRRESVPWLRRGRPQTKTDYGSSAAAFPLLALGGWNVFTWTFEGLDIATFWGCPGHKPPTSLAMGVVGPAAANDAETGLTWDVVEATIAS